MPKSAGPCSNLAPSLLTLYIWIKILQFFAEEVFIHPTNFITAATSEVHPIRFPIQSLDAVF